MKLKLKHHNTCYIWVTRGITKYMQNGWSYSVVPAKKVIRNPDSHQQLSSQSLIQYCFWTSKYVATIKITELILDMSYKRIPSTLKIEKITVFSHKKVIWNQDNHQQHWTEPPIWYFFKKCFHQYNMMYEWCVVSKYYKSNGTITIKTNIFITFSFYLFYLYSFF